MAEKECSSIVDLAECRVSSVLNRNTKNYGKQFLFDEDPETCWSSDQGTPQWVALKWNDSVKISKIESIFQVSLSLTKNYKSEIRYFYDHHIGRFLWIK